MRRVALIACLPAAAALFGTPAATAQDRPPLRAWLVSCVTGPGAMRSAVFTGQMPAIAGTMRMRMRFDLFERARGGDWRTVRLPAWGRWERSEARRTAFIYTKRVDGLRASAAYRARVRFRWLRADGKVLRRAARVTRACVQPPAATAAAPAPALRNAPDRRYTG